jgi:hypothetical protein
MEPAPRARFEIQFTGGSSLSVSVPSQAAATLQEDLLKEEAGWSKVIDNSDVLNNLFINRSLIAYFRVFRA